MSSTANPKSPWLVISRPEFLPANSASLVIGLAWGLTLPVADLIGGGLVVPLVLAFAVISLVGAFGSPHEHPLRL